MDHTNSTSRLKARIHLLEIEQGLSEQHLKEQFQLTYKSLKPANLVMNTIKDITTSPNFVNNIIGTTAGIATGYLSKKIVVGFSSNIIRKLFGSILQYAVTSIVAKNPETIKTFGKFIINKLPLKKNINSNKP